MINTHEVVKILIGPIDPVGESHVDEKRKENMLNLILLMTKLIDDIDNVAYRYKDHHQGSIREIQQIAEKFMNRINEE